MRDIDRRRFLAGTAGAVALSALPTSHLAAANQSANKVVLAIMGLRNRGVQLAERFNQIENVEIAYVCDCDERQIAKGIDVASAGGTRPRPQGVSDSRQALDDPAVDALVVAVPNHWHAAATIAGCQAGKHVYVEKPCSQTAEEGELMMAAAERHDRVVQVGMQRRSGALYRRLVERVREGAIGEVLYAKSYYYRNRPTIGHAKPEPPPAWLDFDVWQGPATEREYQSNILHYNWHNFWHWGNGEIGNNGVHSIDICRWAMDMDFPTQVDVQAMKLRYDDDAETPDTMTAHFREGNKLMVWEGVSWSDPYRTGEGFGIELRGTEGTLVANDSGYTIYDISRAATEHETGSRGDVEHCQDFVDRIRNGGTPQATLQEGHRSAMFCHLANIAHRSGESLNVDARTGHLVKPSEQAAQLWSRDYRSKWMPSV
ncbi:Gfo/Idh/MocA family protein [Aeoliella mucimassa]|uniref:Putative oxidoreductase YdgJ n=1 Tax=Aeoliella mucimassa TaxID=2527972 RepID=A0A518ALY6_9BACT|nr:Gfo/Idh/MocA family oxidoreductase [Aeoliella mucimassa]QDU55731.1 putative oxidoreductase YdgJ [Aeoliella mucimassa]